jgi:hypothetical protein
MARRSSHSPVQESVNRVSSARPPVAGSTVIAATTTNNDRTEFSGKRHQPSRQKRAQSTIDNGLRHESTREGEANEEHQAKGEANEERNETNRSLPGVGGALTYTAIVANALPPACQQTRRCKISKALSLICGGLKTKVECVKSGISEAVPLAEAGLAGSLTVRRNT